MRKKLLNLFICASFTIGAFAHQVVTVTNGNFTLPDDGKKYTTINKIPGWHCDSTTNDVSGREAAGTAYINGQKATIYNVVDLIGSTEMKYVVTFTAWLTYTAGPSDTTFVTAYFSTFSGSDRTNRTVRDSVNFIFSKSNNPGKLTLTAEFDVPAAAAYAGDSLVIELGARYPLVNSNTWIGFDNVSMIKSRLGFNETASLAYTKDTIGINGTIDAAWAGVTQNDITRVFAGDTFANAADLSGYWKAVYNDTGIFVLVNTTQDNIRYSTGSFGAGYEKDGFEVYFDVNDTLADGGAPGGGTWDGHNAGHYQIGVDGNLDTPTLPGWCKGCKLSVNAGDTTSGVNYPIIGEIYVPWKTLASKKGVAYKPKYDKPFGFDVYLIDNDGPASGEKPRRRLAWSNYGDMAENYNNMNDAGILTPTGGFYKNTSVIAKASAKVTIDGLIDAAHDSAVWSKCTEYDITRPFIGDTFDNAADLSGYWKAAATGDSGIYVLVNTTKDNLRYSSGTFGAGYEKDGFEVYFDMNVDSLEDGGAPGGGTWDGHNSGHYQIGVDGNLDTPTLPGWCTGCKIAVNAADTISGVNYPIISEIYVPWKILTNKQGKHANLDGTKSIGFDVYLVDNDGPASGKKPRRRMAWSNNGITAEDYNNMDDAGLMLVPKIAFINILDTLITVTGAGGATTISTNAGTLQMTATVLPANADKKTVTWSVDKDTIGTISAGGLLKAVANGVVKVTATAKDGSGVKGTLDITITNQIDTTSVKTGTIASLRMAPNPVGNELNIISNELIKTVDVISVTGQTLLVNNFNSTNVRLKLTGLQNGVYLVRVRTATGTQVQRIVKN